jgi:hypothetical protein
VVVIFAKFDVRDAMNRNTRRDVGGQASGVVGLVAGQRNVSCRSSLLPEIKGERSFGEARVT